MLKTLLPHRFYFSKWYWYWQDWQQFWRFFHGYRQLDDLDNLIDWASRKRLTGVKHAYLRRYEDLEYRLFNEKLRYRSLANWSYGFYQIASLLSPPPHYHQGYAAQYQ